MWQSPRIEALDLVNRSAGGTRQRKDIDLPF